MWVSTRVTNTSDCRPPIFMTWTPRECIQHYTMGRNRDKLRKDYWNPMVSFHCMCIGSSGFRAADLGAPVTSVAPDETGYDNQTTARIAEQAGVTRQTFSAPICTKAMVLQRLAKADFAVIQPVLIVLLDNDLGVVESFGMLWVTFAVDFDMFCDPSFSLTLAGFISLDQRGSFCATRPFRFSHWHLDAGSFAYCLTIFCMWVGPYWCTWTCVSQSHARWFFKCCRGVQLHRGRPLLVSCSKLKSSCFVLGKCWISSQWSKDSSPLALSRSPKWGAKSCILIWDSTIQGCQIMVSDVGTVPQLQGGPDWSQALVFCLRSRRCPCIICQGCQPWQQWAMKYLLWLMRRSINSTNKWLVLALLGYQSRLRQLRSLSSNPSFWHRSKPWLWLGPKVWWSLIAWFLWTGALGRNYFQLWGYRFCFGMVWSFHRTRPFVQLIACFLQESPPRHGQPKWHGESQWPIPHGPYTCT